MDVTLISIISGSVGISSGVFYAGYHFRGVGEAIRGLEFQIKVVLEQQERIQDALDDNREALSEHIAMTAHPSAQKQLNGIETRLERLEREA